MFGEKCTRQLITPNYPCTLKCISKAGNNKSAISVTDPETAGLVTPTFALECTIFINIAVNFGQRMYDRETGESGSRCAPYGDWDWPRCPGNSGSHNERNCVNIWTSTNYA